MEREIEFKKENPKVKESGESTLRIVFIYLAVGILWIILSDKFLLSIAPETEAEGDERSFRVLSKTRNRLRAITNSLDALYDSSVFSRLDLSGYLCKVAQNSVQSIGAEGAHAGTTVTVSVRSAEKSGKQKEKTA